MPSWHFSTLARCGARLAKPTNSRRFWHRILATTQPVEFFNRLLGTFRQDRSLLEGAQRAILTTVAPGVVCWTNAQPLFNSGLSGCFMGNLLCSTGANLMKRIAAFSLVVGT